MDRHGKSVRSTRNFRKKRLGSSLGRELRRSVVDVDQEGQNVELKRGVSSRTDETGALELFGDTGVRGHLSGRGFAQGVSTLHGRAVRGAGHGWLHSEPLLYIPRQVPASAGKTIDANVFT